MKQIRLIREDFKPSIDSYCFIHPDQCPIANALNRMGFKHNGVDTEEVGIINTDGTINNLSINGSCREVERAANSIKDGSEYAIIKVL